MSVVHMQASGHSHVVNLMVVALSQHAEQLQPSNDRRVGGLFRTHGENDSVVAFFRCLPGAEFHHDAYVPLH